MEINKVESPDYQMMDISEAATADNISTESPSPTISNQCEMNGEKSNESMEAIIDTVKKSLKLTTTSSSTTKSDKENLENRNTLTTTVDFQQHPQKLTPVRHHPLEFFEDDDDDSEDSYSNSRPVSNYPDVVPQPLRLAQPRKPSDLVNSVNNNNEARKVIYREPSPVSTSF